MPVTTVEEIAEAGGILAIAGGAAVMLARDRVRRWRHERRAVDQSRAAEAAAVEASWEESAFAPDVIRSSVLDLLATAQRIWRAEADQHRVAAANEAALGAWVRSHGLTPAMHLTSATVEVLRIVNRAGENDDRAIVRIRVRIGFDSVLRRLRLGDLKIDERWTLARHGTVWHLIQTHGDPLASELQAAASIPSAWADEQRLRESALTELAASDRTATAVSVGELIQPDRDVAEHLADLATVDARFLPDLLEAELGRLVEAWEEATIGSDAPLLGLATADAQHQLLHIAGLRGELRLILQDAVLKSWAPHGIHRTDRGAQIDVTLTLTAIRYLVDPETGVLIAGSSAVRHAITVNWTLELTDRPTTPWQLIASDNPAASIPGR